MQRTLENRVKKLEETTSSGDPQWRERRARDFAAWWCRNVEPLFAKIYGRTPQTEDQVYGEHLKRLCAHASEKSYEEYLSAGEPVVDRLFTDIAARAN